MAQRNLFLNRSIIQFAANDIRESIIELVGCCIVQQLVIIKQDILEVVRAVISLLVNHTIDNTLAVCSISPLVLVCIIVQVIPQFPCTKVVAIKVCIALVLDCSCNV